MRLQGYRGLLRYFYLGLCESDGSQPPLPCSVPGRMGPWDLAAWGPEDASCLGCERRRNEPAENSETACMACDTHGMHVTSFDIPSW